MRWNTLPAVFQREPSVQRISFLWWPKLQCIAWNMWFVLVYQLTHNNKIWVVQPILTQMLPISVNRTGVFLCHLLVTMQTVLITFGHQNREQNKCVVYCRLSTKLPAEFIIIVCFFRSEAMSCWMAFGFASFFCKFAEINLFRSNNIHFTFHDAKLHISFSL